MRCVECGEEIEPVYHLDRGWVCWKHLRNDDFKSDPIQSDHYQCLIRIHGLEAEVSRLRAEVERRKNSYELVSPLEDGVPVQYVGVCVLDWERHWGRPACGFREILPPEES